MRYRKEAFYTANGFACVKRKIETSAGVKFKIKDFRSTPTTMAINDNQERLPTMSAQLRHAKIETTQKYYADIKQGSAGRQLRDVWRETNFSNSA